MAGKTSLSILCFIEPEKYHRLGLKPGPFMHWADLLPLDCWWQYFSSQWISLSLTMLVASMKVLVWILLSGNLFEVHWNIINMASSLTHTNWSKKERIPVVCDFGNFFLIPYLFPDLSWISIDVSCSWPSNLEEMLMWLA